MDKLVETNRIQSNHVQYFSKQWYYEAAVSIALTVLGTSLSAPIFNFLSWDFLSSTCKRCRDRGCCRNKLNTKNVLQRDYEQVYDGLTFELEARYARLISMSAIVLTFSLGMPIMYLFALLLCISIYWTDKYSILCVYKNPPHYNKDPTLHAI
jgi:hypothetical protein